MSSETRNGAAVYHIYGRESYPESLRLIEKVRLESGETIQQRTEQIRNRAEWIELVAIPDSAIVTVIGEGDSA